MPFQVTSKRDNNASINLQSITAMPQYENKSFEELRFEDYSQGNKGSASTPTAGNAGGFGGFGAAPAPSGGALFGQPAPAPGGFGGFGAVPAPAPAGGSLFGQPAPVPAGGGLFGQPAPAPGGFGGFGSPSPAPAGGSLFGQPAPAPAGGGLFGQPAPAPGGFGVFGSPSPAPAGGGLFGQPAPSPGGFGGFGQPAPAPFGQPAAQSQALVPFAPQQQQPGGLFASTQMAPIPVIPPGTFIISPSADEQNLRSMSALMQTKNEIIKKEIWTGEDGKSKASTPTSVNESQSLALVNYDESKKFFPETPISRIRPRFPKTESPAKATLVLTDLGRGTPDGSSHMRPESNSRSTVMQLHPKALTVSKPRIKAKPSPAVKRTPQKLPEETVSPPPADDEAVGGSGNTSGRTFLADPKTNAPSVESTPDAVRYYNKIMSSPPASTTQGSSERSPAVPILTKQGYETNPPMEELEQYSTEDLANVSNFAVIRPGFGKVEWLGAVDVRNANIDESVEIEHKDISVYHKEEQSNTKPLEGHCLNRPAILTYMEMYPKNGPASSDAEKAKYAAKLEKKTVELLEAEFIEYNKVLGTWSIKVPHFSRYALVDSDDEEENAPPHQGVEFVGTPATPQTNSLLQRKGTPFPMKNSVSFDVDVMSIREQVKISTEKAYAEVFTSKTTGSEVATPIEDVEMDSGPSKTSKIHYEPAFMPPTKDEIDKSCGGFSIVSKLLDNREKEKKSAIDVGLRMGRSFRVAFAPNGTLLVPSPQGGSSLIKAVQPVYGPEPKSGDEVYGHLEALFEACNVVGKHDCAVFEVPKSGGSHQSRASFVTLLEELHSLPGQPSEGRGVFKLLQCLLAASDDEWLAHSNPPKSLVLDWLADECGAVTDSKVKNLLASNFPIAAVFAALSSGNVDQACTVAQDSGLHDLAVLIATISSAGIEKSSDLVKMVVDSGVVPKLSFEVDRLIKSIAGSVALENREFKEGSSELEWRQRLALRCLASTDHGMSKIVADYEKDVAEGLVPHPSPLYTKSTNYESVQFKLLRALSGDDSLGLANVVDSTGFTEHHSDMSLAFHLASVIASTAPKLGSIEQFESICCSYASQLIDTGDWAWGCVVLLTVLPGSSIPTRRRRIRFAKDVVIRYYYKLDNAAATKEFLKGIPESWFDEALSGRSLFVREYVEYTLKWKPHAAVAALETTYLPNVFFLSEGKLNDVMTLINGMAQTRSDLASAVVKLFSIIEELTAIENGSTPVDMDVLNPLIIAARETDTSFKMQLDRKKSATDYYRFYVDYPMRVSLDSMVHEGLLHIENIRLRLSALVHEASQQKY